MFIYFTGLSYGRKCVLARLHSFRSEKSAHYRAVFCLATDYFEEQIVLLPLLYSVEQIPR